MLVNTDCETEHHGAVPPDAAPARRANLSALADGIAARARAEDRALADVRAAMPMDAAHAALWDDAVHPSPRGYDWIANVVHAALLARGL